MKYRKISPTWARSSTAEQGTHKAFSPANTEENRGFCGCQMGKSGPDGSPNGCQRLSEPHLPPHRGLYALPVGDTKPGGPFRSHRQARIASRRLTQECQAIFLSAWWRPAFCLMRAQSFEQPGNRQICGFDSISYGLFFLARPCSSQDRDRHCSKSFCISGGFFLHLYTF